MRMTQEQLTAKMRENPSLRIKSQFGTEQIATSEKTPGKSKYWNIQTNGYDSKKEADRAFQLQCLEKAGMISDLQEQVTFVLQDGYYNNKGEKIQPITYVADFTYTRKDESIVEDVKGLKTQVYRIKKKLFEKRYTGRTFLET